MTSPEKSQFELGQVAAHGAGYQGPAEEEVKIQAWPNDGINVADDKFAESIRVGREAQNS